MGYTDAQTIHNPATGTVAPASWGDQIRANQEFFAEPPQCSVSGSAVSCSNGSETTLTAGSEAYDTDTMHSTSTNTSRITATTAGKYEFWGTVAFDANGTGYRRVNYKLNGGAGVTIATQNAVSSGGPIGTVVPVSKFTLALSAGDYVEITATQLSGGSLNATLREFGAKWQSR